MITRVLLKLSGERLSGSGSFGIDAAACLEVAMALKQLASQELQVGVVIGAGNLARGAMLQKFGMKRTPSDQIGMLGTVMNGLALQQALEQVDAKTALFSGLDCPKCATTYHWREARDALDQGKITLFVGGTGNPYFTTDSAAALRACEIEADLLLKATKVDGIYDKDPVTHSDAKLYSSLTYTQVLEENLKVMDSTAIALCRDNKMPIFVFNMKHLEEGNLHLLFESFDKGTVVKGD